MPESARITSVEALENFRSSLIVYLEKAVRAADEVNDEIVGTQLWLQSDRRVHWESQVRRLTTDLDLRQQELFSARISSLQSDTLMEQKAVQKAALALDNATAKLAFVKQHSRQYENRVAPMAKEIEKVRGFLATDMRHAVAALAQTIKTLNAYADIRQFGATPAPAGETTGGQP